MVGTTNSRLRPINGTASRHRMLVLTAAPPGPRWRDDPESPLQRSALRPPHEAAAPAAPSHSMRSSREGVALVERCREGVVQRLAVPGGRRRRAQVSLAAEATNPDEAIRVARRIVTHTGTGVDTVAIAHLEDALDDLRLPIEAVAKPMLLASADE